MNYRIEAMEILLNEDCLLQRYYPLLPFRESLPEKLKKRGCISKNNCVALSDDVLTECGLPQELIKLFRRFLVMYDVPESKFSDIADIAVSEEEEAAFRELYLLPGVKFVRARLYYDSGYGSLSKIAAALPEEIIRGTSETILRRGWSLKAPLPKEVRTHIAVAKVITGFSMPE